MHFLSSCECVQTKEVTNFLRMQNMSFHCEETDREQGTLPIRIEIIESFVIFPRVGDKIPQRFP